jgi:glucose/arabinose dehydrogenase
VPASALVDAWTADPHFCMIRFASGVNRARAIVFTPTGDLLVAGNDRVTVLWDGDGDGVSDASERSTFAMVPHDTNNNNHGVALTGTHLYASSETTVYRWTYTCGQRTATGPFEIVVHDIPTGTHFTRTLLVDGQNRLYVSIGAAFNVDPTPGVSPPASAALIRRYDLGSIPPGGYAVSDGELFAGGVRNEVGMNFDSQGRLWGVENGRDDLQPTVGDATTHYDNPAEEVNLFDTSQPGRAYGYPFCWSEGIWSGPTAAGTGTQHLDPENPGGFTEAMCQDPTLVIPPVMGLRAHLAPLGIVEYTGTAYPAEFRGNFFVTSHGSWDRQIAQVGRLIVRLHLGANGLPAQAENFLGESNGGALQEGTWAVRPVSIAVDPTGLLTFSDDSTGTVNKIGYRP